MLHPMKPTACLHPSLFFLLLTVASCAPGPATSPTSRVRLDLPAFTGGRDACLVVTDAGGNPVAREGGARCARRFSPCSTFKIPNTLIGLETGALTGPDTVIPWDRERYPREDWWPPEWTDRVHDLRSAFAHSFVPYYRALATRIGREAMVRHLKAFAYGDQVIGERLDAFWLDGALGISADEQVRFLRALHLGRLGVSARSRAVLREIMVHETRDGHVLRAKTGTCGGQEGSASLGWIVGSVERGDRVHFYAFNVDGATTAEIGRVWRFDVLRALFAELKLWPRVEK
jgi:beta-lactamase class D